MPHPRPTCLWTPIGDQHACGVQSEFSTYIEIYFLLIFIYWNNVRTLIRHFDLKWGMSVSDEACRSLWWVFDQACRFQMALRWRMSRSPMGIRSAMSVFDRSPLGLRLVSDNNNIFVNLIFSLSHESMVDKIWSIVICLILKIFHALQLSCRALNTLDNTSLFSSVRSEII